MTGIMHIVQRINNIEKRFKQPMTVMPQPVQEQSFSEVLENTEKKNSKPAGNKALNNSANNISNNINSTSKNEVANLVQAAALKHGVSPKLALAVAKTESSLIPTAVSPAGAVGVMQLMPDTARSLGVKNIYDAEENIDGGVRYLKQMLNTFGGDVNKALAAYNAGPGAVKSYNGIPPYKETQEYVVRVNELAR